MLRDARRVWRQKAVAYPYCCSPDPSLSDPVSYRGLHLQSNLNVVDRLKGRGGIPILIKVA